MRLKDRVIIVTGAAQGLGRAYSHRIAQEGSKLVICDVQDCSETAALLQQDGAEVLALRVDVSDEEQTKDMARQAFERFGRIDGLVNNAGMIQNLGPANLLDVDLKIWDRVMAVNIKGPFLCTRAVFPYMRDQGKGKIVNCGSGIWLHMARTVTGSNPQYVVSKAAVTGLTRSLAREVGAHNININTLAPGFTEAYLSEDDQPAVDPERAFGRKGRPQDITGTIVFLLSDDSDFVTGQMVLVNGGMETI